MFVCTVRFISYMKILIISRVISATRRIRFYPFISCFPPLFAELEGEERKTKSEATSYYRDMLMMQIDAAEIKKKM